jgi:hypothetical protein
MAELTINAAYKKFVDILWDGVVKAFASCFNVKTETLTYNEMIEVMNTVFPNTQKNFYDEKYAVTDWETWKKIIEFDWTNRKKYVADSYDCDNFSGSFCSRAAELFNLNSAGRFTCTVKTSKGQTLPHRAVVIVARDEGKLKVFVFESQNDGWVEVKAGQPIKIGDWKYTANLIEVN